MKITLTYPKVLTSTLTSFALSLGLISASISTAMASPSHANTELPSIGKQGKASQISRTVEVNLEDNYFSPETISVTKNQTVRFVIKNSGEFVHEFNIGTAAMHAGHQKEMMMMTEHGILEVDKINRDKMMMDMGDGETMSHDDPNSVLLEPGETAEIIWQFPEAAELEFACNVPGHYESGMVGEIKVRKGQ